MLFLRLRRPLPDRSTMFENMHDNALMLPLVHAETSCQTLITRNRRREQLSTTRMTQQQFSTIQIQMTGVLHPVKCPQHPVQCPQYPAEHTCTAAVRQPCCHNMHRTTSLRETGWHATHSAKHLNVNVLQPLRTYDQPALAPLPPHTHKHAALNSCTGATRKTCGCIVKQDQAGATCMQVDPSSTWPIVRPSTLIMVQVILWSTRLCQPRFKPCGKLQHVRYTYCSCCHSVRRAQSLKSAPLPNSHASSALLRV